MRAIAIGDAIPPCVHHTGPIEWARYAAINGIFNDIHHHDDEAGRRAGNATGAFGQGNLIWSYLFNMIRGWAGDDAIVREAGCQFRGINTKGDIVTCRGTVATDSGLGSRRSVTLEVSARNQHDVVLAAGSVVVELDSE